MYERGVTMALQSKTKKYIDYIYSEGDNLTQFPD